MKLPLYPNQKLIEMTERAFGISIHQDTNYSDQSERFYRFNICATKNSPVINRIICVNGGFISHKPEAKHIVDYMNKNK